MRRLLQFVTLVLGLLLVLEALCRANAEGLAAVAHRIHFKLALLKAKGPVDFVALGSSRSNDGLGPAALGIGTGFSACTPSTSLASLEYVASHLGPQKRVLVEVSKPTSSDTPMDVLELTPSSPGAFEGDPIGAWLQEHSKLLQLRRAFAFENLPRIYALLFASRFDGSEWLRSRQLIETFRDDTPLSDANDDAEWKPATFANAPPSALDADGERIVAGFERIVATLRANGAQVILMAPPIGAGWRGDECIESQVALRREVARRTNAPFLDFTCAQVNERWFIEGQHLTAPGRTKLSRTLGEAIRALP